MYIERIGTVEPRMRREIHEHLRPAAHFIAVEGRRHSFRTQERRYGNAPYRDRRRYSLETEGSRTQDALDDIPFPHEKGNGTIKVRQLLAKRHEIALVRKSGLTGRRVIILRARVELAVGFAQTDGVDDERRAIHARIRERVACRRPRRVIEVFQKAGALGKRHEIGSSYLLNARGLVFKPCALLFRSRVEHVWDLCRDSRHRKLRPLFVRRALRREEEKHGSPYANENE